MLKKCGRFVNGILAVVVGRISCGTPWSNVCYGKHEYYDVVNYLLALLPEGNYYEH